MPAQLPPLKALKVFEAAARARSLTLAAAELHITHSAVSQQIRLLEAHFGRPLFVRSARGVEPTEAALLFYAEVKASLDRIALAAEQFTRTGEQRIVRVNTTPSIAMRWLIPRLSSFQIENPRIEIRVTTSASDGIDDLREPFDVIVRRAPMSRAGHECIRFLDDVSAPLASPRYLSLHPVLAPEDCLRASLLHLSSRRDAWARWLAAAGVVPPPPLGGHFYEHFFLSLQAATADLGIAIGSLALVDEDLATGRLCQLFPDVVVRDQGFHMLLRTAREAASALSVFTGWLAREGARASSGLRRQALVAGRL
ncbi:LysR substrate-binding domain-containing protein [Cupriavidus sp. PET2-C1]